MCRRLIRCKTAVLVVMSLLFSQIALASYLCPAQAPSPAMEQMAPGTPCEGMDADQPALCHQHAADPGQVVQPAQVVAPSLAVIIQVLLVPVVLRALDSVAIPKASTPEAKPPPDPIFLSTLRLRV
jgi:hypothetical protein